MKWLYIRFILIMMISLMILHFHLLLAKPNLMTFFRFASIQIIIERYPLYFVIFTVICLSYLVLSMLPLVSKEPLVSLSQNIERRLFIAYGILSIAWIITIIIIAIRFEFQTVHIDSTRLHDLWMILSVFMITISIHLLFLKFKD